MTKKDNIIPMNTDKTRLLNLYDKNPEVPIPMIAAGINEKSKVKIPLIIRMLREVYGINFKNLSSLGFIFLLLKNKSGKTLGIYVTNIIPNVIPR